MWSSFWHWMQGSTSFPTSADIQALGGHLVTYVKHVLTVLN